MILEYEGKKSKEEKLSWYKRFDKWLEGDRNDSSFISAIKITICIIIAIVRLISIIVIPMLVVLLMPNLFGNIVSIITGVILFIFGFVWLFEI